MVGFIPLDMADGAIFMVGMYIHPNFLHLKLMKKLFVYLYGYAMSQNFELNATKQSKPLLAKLLMDFYFSPISRDWPVYIEKPQSTSDAVRIYMPRRGIKERLMRSQKLVLLQEQPANFELAYVNTRYILESGNRIQCEIEMGKVEGQFIYFYDEGNPLFEKDTLAAQCN